MSDKPPFANPPRSQTVVPPEAVHHCGHGVKRELPSYRHVRIWEINCGEVRCSLSEHDFFQPQFINEFIDAALDGRNRPDEWLELNPAEVHKAQTLAAAQSQTTDPSSPVNGGLPK